MIKFIKYIFVALFFILLNVFGYADNNLPCKPSDKPIEITSDRMEVFKDKKLVVFSGNAKVVQCNSVLKSDKLFLYFKNKSDKKSEIGLIETDRIGELEKIEAKGNVHMISDNDEYNS